MYRQHFTNPLTQTPWSWNILFKTFIFDFKLLNLPNLQWKWAITSLACYELKIRQIHAKPWSKANSNSILLKKLQRLKANLENELCVTGLDPIQYMIYLYFQEELSVSDIFERLNRLGLDYSTNWGTPSSVLINLFKNTFKWKLRERSDITKIKSRKLKTTNNVWKKNTINRNLANVSRIREAVANEVSRILKIQKLQVNFSEAEDLEFAKCSNPKKIIFLLKKYYWLELAEVATLKTEYWLSDESISKVFIELFSKIPDFYITWINITESVVKSIFKIIDKSNLSSSIT